MKKLIQKGNSLLKRNNGLFAIDVENNIIYNEPFFIEEIYNDTYPVSPSLMQQKIYPEYILSNLGEPIGGGPGYTKIVKEEDGDFIINTLEELHNAINIISNYTLDNGTATVNQGSYEVVLNSSGSAGMFNNGELLESGMKIRFGGNCEPIEEFTIAEVNRISDMICVLKLTKPYKTATRDPYPLIGP